MSRLPAGRVARWARALGCGCALACGLGATGAIAATTAATVDAAIVTPLSLVNTADLDFGKIIQPSAAGTVVLTPTSSASCAVTGGLIRTGTCQAAEFYGRGTNGHIVRIDKPNGPIVVTSGAATMNINTITIDTSPELAYVSGNVNGNGVVRYQIATAAGLFSFRIGGTLHVKKNQAIGVYTGTFSVSLVYQ